MKLTCNRNQVLLSQHWNQKALHYLTFKNYQIWIPHRMKEIKQIKLDMMSKNFLKLENLNYRNSKSNHKMKLTLSKTLIDIKSRNNKTFKINYLKFLVNFYSFNIFKSFFLQFSFGWLILLDQVFDSPCLLLLVVHISPVLLVGSFRLIFDI